VTDWHLAAFLFLLVGYALATLFGLLTSRLTPEPDADRRQP
jgi:hypothetical protein